MNEYLGKTGLYIKKYDEQNIEEEIMNSSVNSEIFKFTTEFHNDKFNDSNRLKTTRIKNVQNVGRFILYKIEE